MTLTPTQLRALTGKVRRSDQEAWLLERRIPYRWDGVRLLVSCSLVDAWLAVQRKPANCCNTAALA